MCLRNVQLISYNERRRTIHTRALGEPGTTALSCAVMRGDVEIVKILLENGADPYVENDLGMNAFELCDTSGPFPSVKRVLQEHANK